MANVARGFLKLAVFIIGLSLHGECMHASSMPFMRPPRRPYYAGTMPPIHKAKGGDGNLSN